MMRFFHAVATLAGLIIGVGIFGVPYVIAQTGFWPGLGWIVLVGGVILVVHLFYGEVVAATPGKHRLPGYVGRFLGKEGKRAVMVIDVLRFWGLQVAYLIVGGMFLSLLFESLWGGSALLYSMALFGVVAVATFFGLRLVNKIEFYLTGLLVGAILALIIGALPQVERGNLSGMGSGSVFGPYGVIMVALAGAAAIPELWDIVRRNKRVFRASIITGTLLPVLITALFAFAVVGVTGSNTSPEAIFGLQGWLGSSLVTFGAVVGVLAILTSYLVIALYLQEALRYDFLIKRTPAWAFAVGVPLFLYLVGAQNFISVIDIIGSVFFGVEGILIIGIGLMVLKRRHHSRIYRWSGIGILAGLLFVLGVAHKLWQILPGKY